MALPIYIRLAQACELFGLQRRDLGRLVAAGRVRVLELPPRRYSRRYQARTSRRLYNTADLVKLANTP